MLFRSVYLDPPYVNSRGSTVDYREFYHFLEGLVTYSEWRENIDYSKKHLPLKSSRSRWSDPKQIEAAFAECFDRYSKSIIALSYGNKRIPSIEDLTRLLRSHKENVAVIEQPKYKYVLSIDDSTKELLFLGW